MNKRNHPELNLGGCFFVSIYFLSVWFLLYNFLDKYGDTIDDIISPKIAIATAIGAEAIS